MKVIAVILLCLPLFMPVSSAYGQSEDAAMVVDMSGAATYENGAHKDNPVALMDFLAKGDVIKLENGATLVLNYFASGQREEISGPGQITVGVDQSRKDQKVEVKSNKVEFVPPPAQVQIADAQHSGVVALRSPPSPVPSLLETNLNPNKTALRGLPITLTWQPQPGVSRYEVVVADILEDVVLKTETDTSNYLLDKPTLRPGEEYVWKAQDADAPELSLEGQAHFYLLSKEQLSELNHTENYIRKTYKEGSTESLIALAALYMKYELNEEARNVLDQLLKNHPGNRNVNWYLKNLDRNYHLGS